MAEAIGVSAAYLSALEHGKRGPRPTFDFLQRVAGYFHIIWDEAEDLFRLAEESDPRAVIDTSSLSAAIYGFCKSFGTADSLCGTRCDRRNGQGCWKRLRTGVSECGHPRFSAREALETEQEIPIVLLRTTVIRRSP